eukprot:7663989-Prorocentrum_lima.AAC.1
MALDTEEADQASLARAASLAAVAAVGGAAVAVVRSTDAQSPAFATGSSPDWKARVPRPPAPAAQ